MSTRTIQGQKNLQDIRQASKDGIGGSPLRPDGNLKVKGEFAYSSDMWHEDMLWGMALRSPHPRANILGVDISEALKLPGVYAVLTHEDIPGSSSTVWRSRTSRHWRSTRSATTARRSRWSRPTTRRRPAAR